MRGLLNACELSSVIDEVSVGSEGSFDRSGGSPAAQTAVSPCAREDNKLSSLLSRNVKILDGQKQSKRHSKLRDGGPIDVLLYCRSFVSLRCA